MRSIPIVFVIGLAACSSPAGDDTHSDDDDDDDDTPAAPDAQLPEDVDAALPPIDAGPPPDAREPQDLTVCPNGGDFATIGDAIAAAFAGDTLLVCPGLYRERLTIEGKALRIVGTGGAGATFLDGNDGGTVVTVRQVGDAGVVLEGLTIQNGNTTAEGGGVRCEAATLALVADTVASNRASGGGGLYATGCALDIDTSRFEQNLGGPTGGAAMIVDSTGSVHGSVVMANQAVNGGGLAIDGGAFAVTGNQLSANVAELRGGGLYHASDAEVSNNSVFGNQAGWTGGGIHVVAHAPLLADNTVSTNSSTNDGGGIYIHQGSATLRHNTITNNDGGDDGGGIRAFESHCTLEANHVEANHAGDGGGGLRISHVPCTVIDNVVINNVAGGTGGGMDLDNDASTVRGGEIRGNRAGGSGGGIFTWLAPWTGTMLEDVTIADNRAWRGGGIYIADNFMPIVMRRLRITGNHAGHGGGIFVRGSFFTIRDSVFAHNEADTGAAFEIGAPEVWTAPCPCPPANPTGSIGFSVFHDNQGDAAVHVGTSGLTVSSSILYAQAATVLVEPGTPEAPIAAPAWRYVDSFPPVFTGMADPTGVDGNLAVDPMFVDAASADYHLQAGSACIDAGDPELHDDDGTRADMGLVGGAP